MASAVTVQAEVYRWVDAQGQVHFSDRAPDGNRKTDQNTQVETLTLPEAEAPTQSTEPALQESLQRQKKLVQMLEEERLQREQKKADEKQAAEQLEQYCTRFANRMQYLERYNRIYQENEDGTRRYMSDAEMRAYKESVKTQYAKECGG